MCIQRDKRITLKVGIQDGSPGMSDDLGELVFSELCFFQMGELGKLLYVFFS